jgi:hypothetical protein
MNPLIQRTTILPLLIGLALACFGLLPQIQSAPQVTPAPDGCYPAFTTAEGCNALALLGAGEGNTGIGWYSLFSVGDGSFNTGVGAGALALNVAQNNTATGAGAMLLNTSGGLNVANGIDALLYNDSGSANNAVGAFALFSNIDGVANNALGADALSNNIHAAGNTAIGDAALRNNDITGNNLAMGNTAVGAGALNLNTDGDSNTAVGFQAMLNNTDGHRNNAVGDSALLNNTGGAYNQAMGVRALVDNDTGVGNIAIGDVSLGSNVSGSENTVVGDTAGNTIVTGRYNTYIGAGVGFGTPDGNNTVRIADNLNGVAGSRCFIGGITGNPAFIDNVRIDPTTGQLGDQPSSARFKKDIDPMGNTSEAIFSLKPVTFHYKNDKTNTQQWGLIAEEVAKVNPALIAVDKEGKPYTVAYDKINAMLLNEFLKEHRKVEEQNRKIRAQDATIAQLKSGMEALTVTVKEQAAQIQKVSAQLELNRPAPHTVLNSQ